MRTLLISSEPMRSKKKPEGLFVNTVSEGLGAGRQDRVNLWGLIVAYFESSRPIRDLTLLPNKR